MSGSVVNVRVLTVCSACVALALLLSNVKLFVMPQGGSVTACSMFFIVLAGYWFGPVTGFLTGVALGLLQLALGAYVVHPVQLLMDYPLAFGALGLSGFFRKMKFGLPIGYIVGVTGRFLMSFLAGFIFFSSYAPEGQWPVLYSAIYNFSYIWPEALFTLVVISIPAFRQAIDRVGAMR